MIQMDMKANESTHPEMMRRLPAMLKPVQSIKAAKTSFGALREGFLNT